MPIGYLAGSSDYLLWTSGASLMAQRVSTGSITAYRFTSDALKHPFQFLMLAGHFAVWFTGYANSILDLDTGRAVDVPLPSGSAAGGDVIVVARTPAGAKGAIASTAVSWLRVTPQDRLGACRNSL
jgi:streptogramin lyase